jgi:hypothetical protein
MSDQEEPGGAEGTEEDNDAASGLPDESVAVRGSIAEKVSTLSAMTLDLVVGTGTAGKRQYLVPYVDVEMDGEFFATLEPMAVEARPARDDEGEEEDGDESPHTGSVVLSFDNVAFVFARSANRYRKLVKTLAQMSTDELGPMPGRVAYTAKALRAASLDLSIAADLLATMLPAEGPEPTAPTRRRVEK